MHDPLFLAALEMVRVAKLGDYRPEFDAAVKRLQKSIWCRAAEIRSQELTAAPERIDFLASPKPFIGARAEGGLS